MRAISLCSGVGMFDLALRWAGVETIAMCEIEPYCRAVLARNFPGVLIEEDILSFDARPFRGRVDILVGGFPCQDISVAGRGKGIHGSRSCLWLEVLRCVRECRPAICIFENVPALRTRGMDTVYEGLGEAGYSAEAFVVGAEDVGASHRRKRAWIVAYADEARREEPGAEFLRPSQCGREKLADSDPALSSGTGDAVRTGRLSPDDDNRPVADATGEGTNGHPQRTAEAHAVSRHGVCGVFPPGRTDYRSWAAVAQVDASLVPSVEREVCDVADGDARRLARRRRSTRNAALKAIGNALVPQVAYCVIRAAIDTLNARVVE